MNGNHDLLAQFSTRLVNEDQLSIDEHQRIKNLLIVAYPQYADIFLHSSYWGARPNYRLWIETKDGEIVSHLDFETRIIRVGKHSVLIAGVGEVATHPRLHNKGLGRLLMKDLHNRLLTTVPVDFGYLQCRTEVLGFYLRVGWYEVTNEVQFIDPDTKQLTIGHDHSLILSACKNINKWPQGIIDLQGMPC